MLISQSGSFQPFETPINIEMLHVKSKLREREKLFCFFSSDSVIL